MLPRKLIAVFFLQLVVIFTLLMAPWPWLQNAYRRYFLVTGESVFGSFGSQGKVVFRSTFQEGDANDVGAILTKKGVRAVRPIPMRSRFVGYIPTALVVSLVLATPIPWKRRARALLWGLIGVHLFVGLKLLLWLLDAFSDPDTTLALFTLSPFWKNFLHQAHVLITLEPRPTYIVPIFIWILVSFNRRDLSVLLTKAGLSTGAAPAPGGPGSPDAQKARRPHRSRRRR